jgi:hypothetical protein
LLFTATSAFSFNRHKYHSSLTRIDYNSHEKLFEVSIQLFTHDLMPLLEKRKRKKIDLQKTAGIDQSIMDYLNENFVLFDKNGVAKKLKWVGKEIDTEAVWIYLETPSKEAPVGYNLRNTIFFESFAEQTNFVVCRFEDKKTDLMFKVGDKIKEIRVAAGNNSKH